MPGSIAKIEGSISRRRFCNLLAGAATGTILVACSAPASPPAATSGSGAAATKSAPTAAPSTNAATTAPPATKPAATVAPASQPAGQSTIVFWNGSSSPSAQAGWDALSKALSQKNPTLELKRVTQTNMGNIIKVSLTSGTGPDAFEGDVVPAYIQPLVDAKLLHPLDDYFKSLPNLGKVFAWARANATFGGKTWGVPHEVEFIPLFYNKGVLTKAGIKDPPTTSYDDFLTMCKTLKTAGAQPMGLGGRNKTQPGHLFSILAMLTTGKDGFDKILYGDGRWDQPAVLDAATRLKELLDLGYLPPDVAADDVPPVLANFGAGRYAVWPTGTWEIQGFEDSRKNTPSFEYDFFFPSPINQSLKSPQVPADIGGGFAMSSSAKNPDAVATFLDFLMSADAQKIWNEVFFVVAPVPFNPKSENLPPIAAKALDIISNGVDFGYNLSVYLPSSVVTVYWNGLGGILTKQITPKDWIGQMQAAWDKAKSAGQVIQH